MNRKNFYLLIVLMLLIVGGAWAIGYFRSFQKVSIILDGGVSAQIVKAVYEHSPGTSTSNRPVASFVTSFNGKLKKGAYVLKTQATQDFQNISKQFSVNKSPVTINIHLDYSDRKITDLLKTDLPAINQAFRAKYPMLPKTYRLKSGQLFQRGEWYGGLLVSSDDHNDTYRFLEQEQNGKWTLKTIPPKILLTSVDYPNIPFDILSAANSLK